MIKTSSNNEVLKITLFFAVIAVIFYAISVLTEPDAITVTPVNGTADLMQTNLSNTIAVIPNAENLTFYGGSLYTPSDIEQGTPTVFHNDVHYGTYRLILNLPPNKIYGLSMRSANFSQRTFINGVEQTATGVVGSTKEATTPKTTYSTFYFTPQTAQTEIILQYANFYHKTSGVNSRLTISEYQNINEQNQAIVFRVCIVAGCMLTIFIFYAGMFLFFHRKKSFLYFSLCCLAVGLRALIADDKVIMTLLPNLNWFISIALEYLSIITATVTFVAFTHSMFPNLTHRVFRRVIYIVSAVYAGVILLTSTLFYSKLLVYYQLCTVVLFVYILARLAFYTEKRCLENNLILAGIGIFFLGALHDIFYYAFRWHIFGIELSVGFTQATMMIFVFANMIAMAVQFSRIENELNETLQKERALAEENLLLDRLNKMRAEFLGNITHEMKTPLAVMSGYAQLSGRKIAKGMTSDVATYLAKITTESDRLALLVGQLLNLSRIQENKENLHSIALPDVAYKVRDIYGLMVEARGNRLHLDIPADLPNVLADSELILQALLNLLSNANRFTENGVITLAARESGGMVRVSVTDTGCGMTEKQLNLLFTRFSKGDDKNSTGLGLAICKEIVDAHGGMIQVDSESNKGTTVTFTLRPDTEGGSPSEDCDCINNRRQ